MAKKRQSILGQIAFTVVVLIFVILLIVFGIKHLLFNETNQSDNQDELIENVQISFNQTACEIYAYNQDLGFGFMVIPLEFKSNSSAINYDLSNLVTEEGINLGTIYTYENKMKTSNYDFNLLNTTSIITSEDNNCKARIFVPYLIAEKSLTISDMRYDNVLVIDLSGEQKDASELLNVTNEEQIIRPSYDFSCYKPYIESMMKYNGEPYDASMLAIYVFKLTCNEIIEGVYVTSASFTDLSGNVYDAYDESYSSSKVDNIIGKEISVGETYGLFFELYNNEEDHLSYQGSLQLNFSDGSSVELTIEFK